MPLAPRQEEEALEAVGGGADVVRRRVTRAVGDTCLGFDCQHLCTKNASEVDEDVKSMRAVTQISFIRTH